MKNKTQWLGIALLGAALVMMAMQAQQQAARNKAYQEAQAKVQMQQAAQATGTPAAKVDEGTPVISSVATTPTSNNTAATLNTISAVPVKAVAHLEKETLYSLQNSLLNITFTSRGGAVRSVAFKDYAAVQDSPQPYTMTAPAAMPYLALSFNAEADNVDLNNYAVLAQTVDSIVFVRAVAPGITLERRYTLTAPDTKARTANGYTLKQTLSWHNVSAGDLQLPTYTMNIGVISPDISDPQNIFLNFGLYDGSNSKFIGLPYFKGGGFLFWSKPAQASFQQTTATTWAAVKNKFFTLVTTPATPAQGVFTKPILEGTEAKHEAISGAIQFAGPLVTAGSTATTQMTSYFGPKEYARLSSMGQHQDEIMQWGWPIFAFFSKFFISMLNWLAGVAHNYGTAIILLTLIIRAAMWPFTAAAAQASKKMAAVQPILKEAQAKYKDNPEKLQRETLRIFQENQVNPLAGCLPALLQIPVFIGFFYMLRSAAELRFEHFLWIKDLSMPDTIAHVSGFPINPLPVLMLITMYFQIKLTPSSGDPEQQKIMQFTPFLFSFLLYGFSAGLTLYWTLSNLVSIIQQLLVNKQPTLPTSGGTGKNGQVIDVKATTVK